MDWLDLIDCFGNYTQKSYEEIMDEMEVIRDGEKD